MGGCLFCYFLLLPENINILKIRIKSLRSAPSVWLSYHGYVVFSYRFETLHCCSGPITKQNKNVHLRRSETVFICKSFCLLHPISSAFCLCLLTILHLSRCRTLWAMNYPGCTLSVWSSLDPFSYLIWFLVCWAGKLLVFLVFFFFLSTCCRARLQNWVLPCHQSPLIIATENPQDI